MGWNRGLTKDDPRVAKYIRNGKDHSQWKGGHSIDGHGYIKLNWNLVEPEFRCMADSSGWILEHRYMMANHLGRPLTSDGIVHHKDKDISNNNIDNLELVSRSEHAKIHYDETLGRSKHGYIDWPEPNQTYGADELG